MFCPTISIVVGLLAIVAIEARVLDKDTNNCKNLLGRDLIKEIRSYESVKDEIFKYVLNGDFKGKTYDELAKFVDKFGARPSGSEVLEKSIDYMIEKTRDEGLAVTTEEVVVPNWQRGEERLTMLKPRIKDIALLGLGFSVSTSPEGIAAEVVVVNNFDELENLPEDFVQGKIVLFDPLFTTYTETVPYRSQGAVKAAAKGAVASLVRSVTNFSINSPHAGTQSYDELVKKIPSAAISLEDADLIRRMYNRGEKVVLNLVLLSEYDTSISRNTIIDLKGTKYPDKQVIVSAHIDSWDAGQGAMDDGDGIFINWAAQVILKKMNLTPKRTLRTIFWTAEEMGLVGAYAYQEAHKNKLDKITFVLEADMATFAPRGLAVSGSETTKCVVREVLKLFKSDKGSTLVDLGRPGTDLAVFTDLGLPGAIYYNDDERYYWFHHTAGDTLNVLEPDDMDLATAFWTAVSYIIADLSIDIPY